MKQAMLLNGILGAPGREEDRKTYETRLRGNIWTKKNKIGGKLQRNHKDIKRQEEMESHISSVYIKNWKTLYLICVNVLFAEYMWNNRNFKKIK